MKTMLITGASSGIGRAVAEAALAKGWNVGLLARSEAPLAALAQGHDAALALPADVTDLAAVEGAVARLCDQFGRVDVLFNNAGIFTPQAAIDEMAPEDWAASVAVNLTGMFNAARTCFARMRAQGAGRIINNGSVSATTPREGSVAYTATKHGVSGMTKALALDGRALGIDVGQIDIGNAETPMVARLNARREADGLAPTPVMDVADAAASVLYMADLPQGTNVLFHTIMASGMPFVGRG